ncbi:S-adenosyl-L-methionine-dependent methyltransferase [Aspergillus steynii IBT 23096]|uniref:S-adenosyl-L-methionine-dependent methyltransferase n=1 Tax=Aspergillus steynii IBT 23096 TaxID=1392250 RepID=A0A2I2GGV6_9EURO|nr:S-adenosyl-L-methionine-dependent methyltransferase [Aspergillus steynii IBT 23096]PLB52110.1 S-adenosyl-L-methionine-dependent methyltransferase [Aspergillus steynii IBT 23096]
MDPNPISTKALTAWQNHAKAWDEHMGDDGNAYFSALELPILERMVVRRNGARAIDLATGNGLVARWLAREGASVIAMDGSRPMLECAEKRTESWYQQGRLKREQKIGFEVLDVVSREGWEKFISRVLEDGFDIITMNMGLMDISDLKPLASALKRLLKQDGCFVATILHPLFFTSGADRQITFHENPVTGQREVTRSIILNKYLDVPPARQLLFSEDEKIPPPFSFHRPLHELFAPFFQEGLVLDALEETNFDESFVDKQREHSSKNFLQFPKILGFRMRRAAVDLAV